MKNGLPRYYKVYNRAPGMNYFVFDRIDHHKVNETWELEKAEKIVRDLNEKDRKERGIIIENEIETPLSYCGFRSRDPKEIAPMVRYGAVTKSSEST